MALSHEEIRWQLTKPAADVPALVATHPDAADFNVAFAERVDEFTDAAGVDEVWAFGGIDGIFQPCDRRHPEQHGLPSGE